MKKEIDVEVTSIRPDVMDKGKRMMYFMNGCSVLVAIIIICLFGVGLLLCDMYPGVCR